MKTKALTKELNQLLDQGKPLLKKLPPTGITITKEMAWYKDEVKTHDTYGPTNPTRNPLDKPRLQEYIKTAHTGLTQWRNTGELP